MKNSSDEMELVVSNEVAEYLVELTGYEEFEEGLLAFLEVTHSFGIDPQELINFLEVKLSGPVDPSEMQ